MHQQTNEYFISFIKDTIIIAGELNVSEKCKNRVLNIHIIHYMYNNRCINRTHAKKRAINKC